MYYQQAQSRSSAQVPLEFLTHKKKKTVGVVYFKTQESARKSRVTIFSILVDGIHADSWAKNQHHADSCGFSCRFLIGMDFRVNSWYRWNYKSVQNSTSTYQKYGVEVPVPTRSTEYRIVHCGLYLVLHLPMCSIHCKFWFLSTSQSTHTWCQRIVTHSRQYQTTPQGNCGNCGKVPKTHSNLFSRVAMSPVPRISMVYGLLPSNIIFIFFYANYKPF